MKWPMTAAALAASFLANSAFAKSTCTIYKESAPGKFDTVIATKELEDKNEPVKIGQRGFFTDIYANVAGKDGNTMSIMIGNKLTKKLELAVVGKAPSVVLIDRKNRFMVACARMNPAPDSPATLAE